MIATGVVWDGFNQICETKTQSRKIIIVLFASALLLRLIAWYVLPVPIISTNASIAYLGGADILTNGNGFRDPSYPLFTPPLYAVVIAIGKSIFGDAEIPIKALQILCDSLVVVIVYALVLKMFSTRVALFSAATWAVYPFAIYPTIYIGSETFFTLLFCIFLLLVLRAFQTWRFVDHFAAGLILGLATLMRGTTQFLPLFLPAVYVVLGNSRRGMWPRYVVLCIAFTMVLLPWAIRNYLVVGHVIPVASASGVFLLGSAEELLIIDNRNKELPSINKWLKSKGIEGDPRSTVSEREAYHFKAGLEIYKEQFRQSASEFFLFIIKKMGRLWYATESGNRQWLVLLVNVPIYLLAVIGLYLLVKMRHRGCLLILVILAYFEIIHTVTFPMFRYVVPVMPLVIALAWYPPVEHVWRGENAQKRMES
jgi:4-amino-4-deoxy-L-arabinose transferase-like glycosyltransferase